MKNQKKIQEGMTVDDFEAKMDGRNETIPPDWKTNQTEGLKDWENEKIISEEE